MPRPSLLNRRQACLIALALAHEAAGGAELSIEISVLENAVLGVVAQAVLQRAYDKLGVELKTRSLPLRRGVQMANAGEIDGDLMHTAIGLKDWDQLLMIKVPVVRVVFSAYQRGPCAPRVSLDELASQRVAYMRGTKAVESQLPAPALLATNNNLDALRHLQRGIVGAALLGQMETDALLVKHELQDLCKVSEPVIVTELFHSLHSKHEALARRVERTLKAMSERGEIARIWAQEAQRAREALIAPTR